VAVADSEGVSGPAGAALESPVKIRVTDSTGRALPDVLVNWIAQDGGQVEAVDVRTDSLGEARAKWTLGPRTGRQRLRAQVGSGHGSRAVPPVMMEATALAGSATGIVVVSGDAQRGTAGAALPKPVVIKVVDAAGNGVEDVSIVLSPSAGSVPDTVAQSDASGIAKIHWTLGRAAGDHSLGLHVDGVDKSLKVTARANAAAPANLSFDDAAAADTHATHSKGKRLVAVVTDAFGNPVPDARLSFSSKSGSVTPARAVSDSKGRVSVAWTVGTKAGEQSLIGAVVGSDVKGSYVTQVNGSGPDVRQAGKPIEKPASSNAKPATTNLAPTKPKAAPAKAPTSRKRS
jgi:adhesin/invasin